MADRPFVEDRTRSLLGEYLVRYSVQIQRLTGLDRAQIVAAGREQMMTAVPDEPDPVLEPDPDDLDVDDLLAGGGGDDPE